MVPPFLHADGPPLLFFGGKGGVGKSTLAAAAGLFLARESPGRDVLLVSTDPAHSLADCLPKPLPANLGLIQIDAVAALRAFKDAHGPQLREIARRGTFLADEEVAPFLDLSLPGLDELMAFLELGRVIQGGKFARIVVDTAPMGHTLRLLGMFDTMTRWLKALDTLLAKHRFLVEHYRGEYEPDEVDAFLTSQGDSVSVVESHLRDAAKSQFVPVMLPEFLPAEHTAKLIAELRRIGVSVREVVVNRVRDVLTPLCPQPGGQTACPRCRAELARQSRELSRVAALFPGADLYSLPYLPAAGVVGDALASLWPQSRTLAPVAFDPADLPAPAVSAPLAPSPARVTIVAGKGGVGKTTIACATALELARRDPSSRVLLFSTDPAHTLAAALGRPVGPDFVAVAGNLDAIEVDAAGDFAALKSAYADEMGNFFEGLSGGSSGMPFDRAAMEGLLELSPPGLDEVMALARLVKLVSANAYDHFVIDTAPSGHLIRLLELPRLAQDWLKSAFTLFLKYRNVFRLPRTNEMLVKLSRGLKQLQAMLADPALTRLLVVAIPTRLSLDRTRELLDACRRLAIGVGGIVVNQKTSAADCPTCAMLSADESAIMESFTAAAAGLPVVAVSRGAEPRGAERLAALGRSLHGGDA